MRTHWLIAWLSFGIGIAACTTPAIPDGRIACAVDADCPSGFSCRKDALCWSQASDAGISPALDASDPDARAQDAAHDSSSSDATHDANDPSCTGCRIDGVCFEDGAANPESSGCEICDRAKSQTAWSARDGDSCDDGAYCTVNDACVGRICMGTPRNCSDGVDCTGEESCNEAEDRCDLGEVDCPDAELCDPVHDTCVVSCSDCTIDQVCIADGATALGNVCRICDVSRSRTSYSDDDGASCGSAATECSAQDSCMGGVCRPNHVSAGENCGSVATACSAQDTCDGSGNCQANHRDNGYACSVADACNAADTCNGSGVCKDKGHAPVGTPCVADNDPMTPDQCNAVGTCVATASYCSQHACFQIVPTGQARCANATSEIACPGTAGSAACSTTAFCGQDGQYPGSTRTFACRRADGSSKPCSDAIAAGDVVLDNFTGLTWQRIVEQSYGPVCDNSTEGCTQVQAKTYCDELSYGSQSDWRLPNQRELISLLDLNIIDPPTTQFPAYVNDSCWTSSAEPTHQTAGRWAGIAGGAFSDGFITDRHNARCVRGPRFDSNPEDQPPRYFVYGTAPEQVVLDRATSLLWQYTHAEDLTWSQALAYCEGLSYGGFSNWRLPDRFELHSVLNVEPGAYTITDLPNTEQTVHWSSTTLAGAFEYAWAQTYYNLNDFFFTKDELANVRCVRAYP